MEALVVLVLFGLFVAWLFGDLLMMVAAFLANREQRELAKYELKLELLRWLARQIGTTEAELRKRG